LLGEEIEESCLATARIVSQIVAEA